jgi:AcrR family transcriptional regulator
VATPPTKAHYHHGNLRAALIDAAFELARAGGPDAVVLREASRQVGVSHNAAYRHFPGRHALLREIGERCMRELALLMETLIAEVDPNDRSPEASLARLHATGVAYVQFALAEPGLFRTGFTAAGRGEHAVPAEPGAAEHPGPLELLGRQLDGMVEAGAMGAEMRPLAEFAAWSAVHGFSMLCLDGPLSELPEAERQAALERTLEAVERGLRR